MKKVLASGVATLGEVGRRIGRSRILTPLQTRMRKVGKAIEKGRLRRRRSRAGKKRSSGRQAVVVLLLSLVLLLGLFVVSLRYLEPAPTGQQLTINQLAALADAGRLESARFHDEDAVITGTFADLPASEEPPAGAGEVSEKKSPNQPGDNGVDKAQSKGRSASKDKGRAATKDKSKEKEAGDSTVSPGFQFAALTGEVQVPEEGSEYWVVYPESDAVTGGLVSMAAQAGATVAVDPQSVKSGIRAAATFLLPLMILANLFALLFSATKGGGSGIGDIMSFGTVGKRGRKSKKTLGAVTFDQVAGADEAVAELREVVDYLQDTTRYEEAGAIPPKGVLLVGPPGCGKTLIAKAVAGEAGVPFFSVAGAEFVESLVGVGAARVRDLFQRVRAVAPAIVFIDELDAAGRKRGSGGSDGGSDEREQTLNQMLVEMDGFEVSSGMVVIGATNRPDILDPALLRPGRFDRHVTVDQPDLNGRREILELHAVGKLFSPMVDFGYIAKRTPGFSGADLANVINESTLLALRERKSEIETADLEEAIQRVLTGPKKKGQILSPEERKRVAYHEGGHAVVAAAAGRYEEIHRVSVLSRGKGLGNTTIQANEAIIHTKSQLIAQLVTAMGGIASEMLIFGEPSTGAEQDLDQATDLARDMVGRFGMGSRRRRLLTKEGESFLGDELFIGQISGQTHQEMEHEIDVLIQDAEREATRLLDEHREILDVLASRLELDETLEGTELEAILAQVRPEVTFFGGPGEGPIRHDVTDARGPMEQV